MKQAIVMIGLAGLAGAGWFRSAPIPGAPTAKIKIPALDGFDADQTDPFASEFDSPPGGKIPAPIAWAQSSSPFQTVSDEQPFAVSDADVPSIRDELSSSKPSDAPQRDALWEDVETKPAPAKIVDRPTLLSGQGRPIAVKRIGQGRFKTLVISGLDGRDQSAVQWVDDLAEALDERDELLRQQEFIIVRAANPDGLAARSRGNATGVVLDRNFPTRRFRASPADATGVGPASEVETRALLQLFYEIRPHRVVHLTSTSGKSTVFFNQPATSVADRLQRNYALQKTGLNLDQWPGSLEEYVDATWKAEVVTLQLHGGPESERQRLPLLLSSIALKEPAQRSEAKTAVTSKPSREPTRWQSGPASSPIPANSGTVSSRREPRSNRGYEELPAPPE